MHGDMDVDEEVLSDPPPADISVHIPSDSESGIVIGERGGIGKQNKTRLIKLSLLFLFIQFFENWQKTRNSWVTKKRAWH
jgi:hypothetical protein